MIGRCARRYFSSKAAAQRRPTKVIENLLKEHGPQTVNNCWKLAAPAGIKSKTHMKTMLHWLVERDRLQINCNHLKHPGQKVVTQTRGGKQLKSGQGFKEFLFGIRQRKTKKKEEGEDSAKVGGEDDDSAKLGESDESAKLDKNQESAKLDRDSNSTEQIPEEQKLTV
ncbi:hypothetical protein GOP47_0000421 [Adiantum capillus-veneris]|uniref:Uncharacterized protein n=1 Tax=Adiantum capillus-veneris TaxID=13818 RepID=A0A9D4VF42_ADICA|nr:hypothetical protein GOP47_0000421 [Adiantum capillus-veneris]